ncbi:hypothetical protein SDJN03_02729, partial [Cucurbita argyrosperma subsp. sororia]
MRNVQVAFRTIGGGITRKFKQPSALRSLSTNAARDCSLDDEGKSNSFESADDFERRIFGGVSLGDSGNDAFFEKLDRLGKPRERIGSRLSGGNNFQALYGIEDNLNTLSDGMDDNTFEFIQDLDLTKPGVRKPPKRVEFQVTTEEVLRKADFRNVRFVANFITDAGIINKRSKTGISAKAQRKVAKAQRLNAFHNNGNQIICFWEDHGVSR